MPSILGTTNAQPNLHVDNDKPSIQGQEDFGFSAPLFTYDRVTPSSEGFDNVNQYYSDFGLDPNLFNDGLMEPLFFMDMDINFT
jgi:hypothetical protein